MWFYQRVVSLTPKKEVIFFWSGHQFKVDMQGKVLNEKIPEHIQMMMKRSTAWKYVEEPKPQSKPKPESKPIKKKKGK